MRKTLYLLSLLSLVGCGGINTNMAQQRINNAGNREMAAWQRANAEAMETCPQGTQTKPLPRSKAMDTYKCRVGLLDKYVRPVAYSPVDLNQYILDEKKVATAYKNGKIDREEANIQLEQAFNAYVVRIDQKSRQELINANQRDWALSQQLGQMSQQVGAIEAQNQQSMRDNRPINTNCNRIGNSVNCTTW